MSRQVVLSQALTSSSEEPAVLRFGPFELDERAGLLRRGGHRLRLQAQPLKLLAYLAHRPGELVRREQLRDHLWGAETFVEWEQGLHFAVREIRRVLGDHAEAPRYLETVPRQGYRFVAEVVGEAPADPPAARSARRWGPRRWALAAGVLLAALALGASRFGEHPEDGLAAAQRELFERRDLAAAERAISRELAPAPDQAPDHAPDHAAAHSLAAYVDAFAGRRDAAVTRARQALALDARSPQLAMDVCWFAYFAGRWDDAVADAHQALALSAAHGAGEPTQAYLCWLLTEVAAGRAEAARGPARKLMVAAGASGIELAAFDGADPARALTTFWQWVLVHPTAAGVPPDLVAAIAHRALGDRPAALAALETLAATRPDLALVAVHLDPGFTAWHEEPRLRALQERLSWR